uniref:Uncharacterized protein n=1 Tax=Chromera velia CCMP2878 TaxID=1169474 RepID=A0A0G4F4G8_9ALVE|eukprot:Cvel_15182.t1-p1 / transcript=Cvel_15182.t1 / gene=Cvel_15182 / organism=Chromera_velia_CCMP2878 / gene_product=hypothetical protein / transcript_product=hypothetical protein / location=Cvel_scaffold1110:6971-11072(-) / protein_length=207 / sequence_SO=supercontig / SO=protein_coding / is_pseudo=false
MLVPANPVIILPSYSDSVMKLRPFLVMAIMGKAVVAVVRLYLMDFFGFLNDILFSVVGMFAIREANLANLLFICFFATFSCAIETLTLVVRCVQVKGVLFGSGLKLEEMIFNGVLIANPILSLQACIVSWVMFKVVRREMQGDGGAPLMAGAGAGDEGFNGYGGATLEDGRGGGNGDNGGSSPGGRSGSQRGSSQFMPFTGTGHRLG